MVEREDVIVRAAGVRKSYETGSVRVEALRGVDLELRRGEMVAIMGPSGCGKTTLLNCLSGLDEIDAGELEIEGTPLADLSDRRRTDYRARRMGFVFQFYNLIPVLTAVENVELPLLVARVRAPEARRRARAALALVGLGFALCGLASFFSIRLLGLLFIYTTLADIAAGLGIISASLVRVELPPALHASNNMLFHGMSNSLLFFRSADL